MKVNGTPVEDAVTPSSTTAKKLKAGKVGKFTYAWTHGASLQAGDIVSVTACTTVADDGDVVTAFTATTGAAALTDNTRVVAQSDVVVLAVKPQNILDLLAEIGDTIGIMPGTTICGLADGAAWPIKNAINKFRDEFEDYIKRTNPTGYMQEAPAEALQLVELAH